MLCTPLSSTLTSYPVRCSIPDRAQQQNTLSSNTVRATNFHFSLSSRPTTQSPIQWVPGALSQGVKRPGSEAEHSPSTNVEVKKRGFINPLPHTSSWCSASLVKQRDYFTFLPCSLPYFNILTALGDLYKSRSSSL
jgi:hypothetical protein